MCLASCFVSRMCFRMCFGRGLICPAKFYYHDNNIVPLHTAQCLAPTLRHDRAVPSYIQVEYRHHHTTS